MITVVESLYGAHYTVKNSHNYNCQVLCIDVFSADSLPTQ